MDINDLLTREQIERARARATADPAARAVHQDLAGRYRGQVDSYRRGNGAPGRLESSAPLAAPASNAA